VQVELTKAGEALHGRLRTNVIAFDQQLRADLGEAELNRLRATLRRLEENLGSD
jgi:DNA-binding MarR family transcriptional regulator